MNLKCPKCGNTEEFIIYTDWHVVIKNGEKISETCDYTDGDNMCWCKSCNDCQEILEDFKVKEKK